MTLPLSPNTQAILLLTAPLIAGHGALVTDLLTPGEYRRLARQLHEIQRQPADLLSQDAAEILLVCQSVIDESRLKRLLGRGFLLSQVVERWQARSIWVVSRADANYPRRLKTRLREDAPAVLYGCGNIDRTDDGGLAVVGSRHVDDATIDYTMAIGRLAARSGRVIVSGGARGIDQAAMRGALEAGGKACGILADSLEKTTMNREHRNMLLDGQLTLISPYDPSAGFNVGNAMRRNKLIYALADVSLVVSSDFDKGGTWAGAVEQIEKLRFVPLYVRSTGEPSVGLNALRKKGALSWPNPQDTQSLDEVFNTSTLMPTPSTQASFAEFDYGRPTNGSVSLLPEAVDAFPVENKSSAIVGTTSDQQAADTTIKELSPAKAQSAAEPPIDEVKVAQAPGATPADALFDTARKLLLQILRTPMKDTEVATALDVSSAQAKVWLKRLVDDGVIMKQKAPACYIVKESQLFK